MSKQFTMLVAILLLYNQSLKAQDDYRDVLNIYGGVTNIFANWVNSIGDFAEQQDRKKLRSFANNLKINIGDVIRLKKRLEKQVVMHGLSGNHKADVEKLITLTNNTLALIDKHKELIAKYGGSSVDVRNKLLLQLDEKANLLGSLSFFTNKSAPNKDWVIKTLQQGIVELEKAKQTIDVFLSKFPR